jgi:fatty acid CoA ligase FadD9
MNTQRSQEDVKAKALERYRSLQDRDLDLRRSMPSPAARERLQAEGLSSLRRFILACELYADRPCFAEREFVVEDGKTRALPAFRHITFAQLWERVQAFASGMARIDIAKQGAMVGLSGFPSIDGVVADLACLYLGAVSVPLSTTASPEELGRIVASAELSTILCNAEHLDVVTATLGSVPGVRDLVVLDVREQDRAQAGRIAIALKHIHQQHPAVRVHWMAEVERIGREGTAVPPVEPVPPDALRTLVYTSGSTGTPKGAMLPERVWTRYWQRSWEVQYPDVPYVTVSYMPLNHVAGRWSILRSLMAGGLTSFVAAQDMSTLFDDIRIARPTTLLTVPRVANLIYQRFQTLVMRHGGRDAAVEAQVMDEMRRTFLGDRLLNLTTGSAPTAPDVVSFLTRCFETPVIDGYGLTEVGVLSVDGQIDRENVVDYRIVDVPELGYTQSDRPYPRGELRVKTRRTIPGYYRSPEATRDQFDEAGYFCTGDVVEQRGPDEIAWIDRKKNVLKLSQGEFVSVSRLEELYVAGSPFIGQIFLYGTSLWSYLLAVVVPEGTTDKALLRGELDRVAAREGLRGYEVPRDFIVETSPFTREGGLLTDSGKPSRPKLRARFAERLEQLHAGIERRQVEELQGLESDRSVPAREKVARAFAVTLGLSERELRESDQSFQKLGGDSLGAVSLVERIRELCGVDLPVAMVLDPTSSLSTLMRAVDERLAEESRRPTFAQVHGAGSTSIRAEDLRVERFIPSSELDAAPITVPSGPPVVVLTGANGFLGRFLLLELLERVAKSRGKVVAIVRAPSDVVARERLAASYALVDPKLADGQAGARADAKLAARFAALSGAQGRLEVIAGDLIKPRLGLAQDRWDRLAAEVSAIVHPGALVNHALSYPQLFEPNVLGTVEVMRLALPRRAPIGFVSTIGVGHGVDRAAPIREDEDAASLGRVRPIDSGYAVGYGTSKWADEILLRDLQARSGVPVSAFRGSMMMPPASFDGPLNADDLLTRILQSLVLTGVAPRSFYAQAAKRRHFDGLPVDVVARDIAAVALATREGFATYHVVDGHVDDGVSLDTFVEWVRQAGYPIEHIADYAAWLRTFRERLEALGPAEQQHSALAGLKAWERPSGGDVGFDNRLLRRRLRALGEAPDMPSIDDAAIERYLRNMVLAGLIPQPRAQLRA